MYIPRYKTGLEPPTEANRPLEFRAGHALRFTNMPETAAAGGQQAKHAGPLSMLSAGLFFEELNVFMLLVSGKK